MNSSESYMSDIFPYIRAFELFGEDKQRCIDWHEGNKKADKFYQELSISLGADPDYHRDSDGDISAFCFNLDPRKSLNVKRIFRLAKRHDEGKGLPNRRYISPKMYIYKKWWPKANIKEGIEIIEKVENSGFVSETDMLLKIGMNVDRFYNRQTVSRLVVLPKNDDSRVFVFQVWADLEPEEIKEYKNRKKSTGIPEYIYEYLLWKKPKDWKKIVLWKALKQIKQYNRTSKDEVDFYIST